MMKRFWALCLIVLVAIGASDAQAGRLRKVWELDLKKALQGTPVGQASLPVFLLRFSPDGQQLAAVVDLYRSSKDRPNADKSRILLIQVRDPKASLKIYESSSGVEHYFRWSSNGKIISAANNLIRVADGKTCGMPPGFFIGDDRLLARFFMDRVGLNLTFFSTDCEPQEKWQVPGDWFIHDASTDRGLIVVSRRLDPITSEILIVDALTKNVLQRWSAAMSPNGQFADSGKALCESLHDPRMGREPVICWDIDTGTKIGEALTINFGSPMETAMHASRVVATDYNKKRIQGEDEMVVKARVVWDFRSGKELVRWRPEFQSYINIIDKPTKDPFPVAISPDGDYIAEGGNGIIRLYKIEP